MFIDTHCHLHDAKLPDTQAVVNAYLRDGVDLVINMGCCADTSEKGKELAEKFDSVYFATGCHPSDVNTFDQREFDRIAKLTSHEKCVAVGEIGLDYYWQPFDKEKQANAFVSQIGNVKLKNYDDISVENFDFNFENKFFQIFFSRYFSFLQCTKHWLID